MTKNADQFGFHCIVVVVVVSVSPEDSRESIVQGAASEAGRLHRGAARLCLHEGELYKHSTCSYVMKNALAVVVHLISYFKSTLCLYSRRNLAGLDGAALYRPHAIL